MILLESLLECSLLQLWLLWCSLLVRILVRILSLSFLSLVLLFLLLVVGGWLLVWPLLQECVVPFLLVCLLLRRTRDQTLVS